MLTMTDDISRVWVGCLACYNDGRLTGEWVDAIDAAEFEPCTRPGHEEFWCMDTENMPVSGELSPMEATRIATAVTAAGYSVDVVRAYIDMVGEHYVEWDNLETALDDNYRGEWNSEQDYAESFADDVYSEELAKLDQFASYIDWEAYARDLFISDFYSVDTPNGGVFVFWRH